MIAASILAFIGGSQIAGRLVGGIISDRIGSKNTLLIGLSLLAISLFWIIWIKEVWMFYLFALIFGFSFGATAPQMPRLVGEFFGLRQLGIILGVATAVAAAGGAVGSWFGGYIFDITGAYSAAFMTGGIIILISLMLTSLFLKTTK